MQTASFWDAPPCRSVDRHNHRWILIQRSGLAEGYTVRQCTILLDLTWPDQDLPLGIITFQKIALHSSTLKMEPAYSLQNAGSYLVKYMAS